MKRWYDDKLCGFDYETTGVDPTRCSPVQVGISLSTVVDGIQAVDQRSYEETVNPGIPITNSSIHNITDEIAARDGAGEYDSFMRLRACLIEMRDERIPVVIFNAAYDWTILFHQYRKFGANFEEMKAVRILDPLVIDRRVDKYVRGKGQRQQGNVAKRYGLEVDERLHSGQYDAELAVQIARAMGRKHPWLSQQLQYQPDWHREQMESLQQYFNKTKPGVVIEQGWPIREPIPDLEDGWSKPASAYEIKDSM